VSLKLSVQIVLLAQTMTTNLSVTIYNNYSSGCAYSPPNTHQSQTQQVSAWPRSKTQYTS